MSVIVPITRQEFVRLPCVSLRPLPISATADPILVLAGREAGIALGAVRWGGDILLMASIAAGRAVTVRARTGACRALHLFAPGSPRTHVSSGRFDGEGRAEVPLDLRVGRAQPVVAVARHGDGSLHGILAELAVSG